MDTGSSKPLEMAALGRPFQLGMLYDCRRHCLISGITLWDHDDLQKDTDGKNHPSSESEVITSDSVENKIRALEIDASLKASILGGQVEVYGSAKYLKDTKESKKQARVTLKYKTTTKFKQLSMYHLGRRNVKYPYVLEQGIATHVVTAVLYGAQAFFVFDRKVSETEDQRKIEGNLEVLINKIPPLLNDGKGSLKLTDSDTATVEKLSCKFYGDFALKQNPVSFQDAVKVYTRLPALLDEKEENAVPVRVWLLPLEFLDSYETQSMIEDFNEMEMQCNDITTRKVIKYLPEVEGKVKSFKDMCSEYKSEFQRSLSRFLPSSYGFRYMAVYPAVVSQTSEAESIKTLPTSPPGKPKKIYADLEEIVIGWTKPDSIRNGISIENYVVEYRIAPCKKNEADWMKKISKDKVCIITELHPDTKYDVRIICDCGESGKSKESLKISISTLSLVEKIKQMKKNPSKGLLSVYKVPLQEIPTNLDGCKRYFIGKKHTEEHRTIRTIMVIGATGAGKSTLINGMINYILDVKWEDNFRFKLIDEGVSKSQAESQTSLVTAYEINYQEGYNIHNSITIIDTPGFGDTRGIERDLAITEQIRTFFTSDSGISDIDAVCFVTQASQARLTPTQKYVFDSILSIFGKDIADSIQMLVTFADGQKPQVLEAINVSGIPCAKTKKGIPVHFKFNNSALFADNSHSVNVKNSDDENEEDGDDNFDKMFWSMGVKSMKNFFVALTSMKTKSLRLTREVLKERKELETAVTGLQPQIRAGLTKLDEIKKTQQIIQEHEAEINTNKNFEFEVELLKPVQVSIAESGQYITNCQECYFTCHFPCVYPNDKDKVRCSAMDPQGNCRVCPGKCRWNVHFNQKYKWEYKKVKEKITSVELKANYEKAFGKKMSAEEIIKRQEEEIQYLQDIVLELMETSQRCLARLQEIALKPNPLSTPEYIDLLIESEKAEAEPGFLQRIQSLEAMKEQAVIIEKVSNKEELLPSEASKYKATRERQEEQNTFREVNKGFLSFFTK